MMETAHEQLGIQSERHAQREAFRRNIRGTIAQRSQAEMRTEDVQRLAETVGLRTGRNTRVVRQIMEGTADAAGAVGEFIAGAIRVGGKLTIPVLGASTGAIIEGAKVIGSTAINKALAIEDVGSPQQRYYVEDERPQRPLRGSYRVVAQPALEDRSSSPAPFAIEDRPRGASVRAESNNRRGWFSRRRR